MLTGYDVVEVEENIKTLEEKFEELEDMVMDLLQERHIQVDQVIHKLTKLPASEQSEHEDYFKENLEELEKCTKYMPLFSRLHRYWNYLSPQLLYHLVNKLLPDTKAKEEIEMYDKELKQFKSHTLVEQFQQIEMEEVEPPEGFSKIISKFDGDIKDMTLEDIEIFRRKFAKHYKLRDFAFILNTKINQGSFVVSFLVPNSVLPRLKKDIPRTVFEECGTAQLDVAGDCIYRDTSKSQPMVPLEVSIIVPDVNSQCVSRVKVLGLCVGLFQC